MQPDVREVAALACGCAVQLRLLRDAAAHEARTPGPRLLPRGSWRSLRLLIGEEDTEVAPTPATL